MTPHTPVEGLVALLAKWRAEIAHYDATCSPSDPEDWVGPKRDCADELEAALASLPVEGWGSMDSAPKDGTEVLLYAEVGLRSGIYVGYYDASKSEYTGALGSFAWRGAPVDAESSAVAESLIKRWQPLPQPPQDQRQGNEQGGAHEL